ncbi:hypothetical protein D3C79_924970 [compost metagenome]
MHHAAAFAITVADQQITTGATLQHHGEILTPGQRLHVRDQAVFAHPIKRYLPGELGAFGMIQQSREALRLVDRHRGAGAETRSLGLGHGGDPYNQLVTHLRLERTHAQLQLGVIGNHVGGNPGVERADGHNRCVERRDIARDNAL